MSKAELLLAISWVAVTAYGLFGGADFGAGIWDLLAGGARRGRAQRLLIEHVIGPVWEANHVWLIFVVVILWTGFPLAFASVFSTMYLPLTAAAIGIILRGSGFAFRKVVDELPTQRLFGATFAAASLLTPFFLGTVAGGVASGRVPLGNAAGDPIRSWVNPTSLLGGSLAVLICAYLAAVFLTYDSAREGNEDVAEQFRARGLATSVVAGLVALAGIGVLRTDAPALFAGLTGRALPLIIASSAGGLVSITLLWTRRYVAARAAASLAVSAILWGWAAAQYPYLLVGVLTIAEGAANQATLDALLTSIGVGAVLLVPSLLWLYVLFQHAPEQPDPGDPAPQTPTDAKARGG